MLIYHPAFDAYHCIFRMLAVSESVNQVEIEKARILDFYLLFPSAVALIRLPTSIKDARRLARAMANPYHDPINPTSMFRDMRYVQEAALKCIAASGLIDRDLFEAGFVKRTAQQIPHNLLRSAQEFLTNREPVASVVLNDLADLPLRGENGLKHRTQMMEYKYDVA